MRKARIEAAWRQFSVQEKVLTSGKSLPSGQTTDEQIIESALATQLTSDHLNQWPVWRGEKDRGTVLFVFGITHELSAWVDPRTDDGDPETENIKEQLRQTLTGFVDPFSENSTEFSYQVVIHAGATSNVKLSADRNFSIQDLRSLEHHIEGRVDENGIFRGRVCAFGKDLGDVCIIPARAPSLRLGDMVGPFDFCIGTFEVDAKSSTHPADQHRKLADDADRYSGLAIYRDGLRVMPYGRPANDFFEIERRRSQHAGREFWSHRRSFGRVAVRRKDNPNLRDKAGREGLIDNRACREFRILVIDILKQSARRYFGFDSSLREKLLPEIKAANEDAKDAETKARQRRFSVFRDALLGQSRLLDEAMEDVRKISDDLSAVVGAAAASGMPYIAGRLEQALQRKNELVLPPRPTNLRNMEEAYRDYRDRYGNYAAAVDNLSRRWALAQEKLQPAEPEEAARSALLRHQKFLTDQIGRRYREIEKILKDEMERLRKQVEVDRAQYYAMASPLLTELLAGRMRLEGVLNMLESVREQLYQQFAARYDSYLRALEQLSENIDLDAVVVWNSEQRTALERQVEELHQLAQLGITVEILGHELNSLDADVGLNLRRLPAATRALETFKLALSAHEALVSRLRFLTPLQLSGPRHRDTITGLKLARYLQTFFEKQLHAGRTKFVITESFKEISFVDYPSRIYPVFVNLINNALYWLTFVEEREVRLDAVAGQIVVADSGKGVDPDDLPHLFTLFFSRKTNGSPLPTRFLQNEQEFLVYPAV